MNSLQDSIEYGLRKLAYDKIKGNQRKVVEAYVAGRDVLTVAPTGSGKSPIFQIAPFVFDFISYCVRESIGSVCLIIAPLLSPMRDQVDSLQLRGTSAACLDAETSPETVDAIRRGEFNLIFGSPESLMNTHRNIFRGHLKYCIDLVVVDESHCIAKWLVLQ